MLGRVCYGEKTGAERELFGDTAVLTAYTPRGKNLRCAWQAHRIAALFNKKRIQLAAFPQDYPYTEPFARCGIYAPDVTKLNLACAAKLTRCVLLQEGIMPERTNVSLISEKSSAEMRQAAFELARTVRYLSLCAPDAREIACVLRWQYGIAAKVLKQGETQRTDLTVLFDGTDGCEYPVLPLAEKDLKVSYRLRCGAEDCTDTQLLAALTQAGAIQSRDLCVERVIFPAKANFS